MINWKYEEPEYTPTRIRTSRIVKGRAYTDNDTRMFTDLSFEQQEILARWIAENIMSRKSVNNNYTSYGIKDIFEREKHFYISNNQFKDAMLLCGFLPVDETELNWRYCISEKSLAFKGVK